MRCRVMNLSPRGVCLAQAGDLGSGERVELTIGCVEAAPAEVVWTCGELAGLRFGHPINVSAARKRRSPVVIAPSAGWAVEVKDAYR